MAKKQSPKTTASKSKKSPPKTKTAIRQSAKSENNPERETSHHKLDNTKARLKELGDKLSEAADKGVHAIKEVAEKIHQFAGEATDLTKLKIELHNLQKEREKFLILMGEQLRNLHKSNKLRNIQTKFKYDFKKIDEIETSIAEKEKEVSRLASDLKSIK